MDEVRAGWGLPPDISTHGHGVDALIDFLHYFMIVLFVAWGIFLVYCLVRFRRRSNPTASYGEIKAKPSKYAEVVVVLIEVVLLVAFSIPVWGDVKNVRERVEDKDAVKIHVVAQQFAWNIHYPGPDGKFGPTDIKLIDEVENPVGLDRSHPDAKDDITTINIMHVPVNKPIIVYLTSKDVIHSFWIPVMRIKQDVVPGMRIPVWMKARQTTDVVRKAMAFSIQLPAADGDVEEFVDRMSVHLAMDDHTPKNGGTILAKGAEITAEAVTALRKAGITEIRVGRKDPAEIQCAQLCGLNHYSMRGFFTVESQEDYDKWLVEQAQFIGEVEEDWGD